MAYGTIKADTLIYDASGSDTSVSLSNIAALSGGAFATFTGDVTINAQKDLRFGDADSSNYVGFQAPATVSSNVVWTLPAADGSAGQQLATDGSGTLSWTSATNVAAADLTGATLASGVTASSLTSVGTLGATTFDGDVTFTGASSNGVWDKSANAFVGNLTGTASTATNALAADTVDTANIQTDATHYLTFTTGSTTGATIGIDGNLEYNPSSNLITAKHLYLSGNYTNSREDITASATPTIDCNSGNYFTLTQNQNISSWTISNVPANYRAYALTLELQNASYSTSWSGFTNLKWPGGVAPTLNASKAHLLIFVTDDGGSNWRGAAIADYTV